MTSCWLRGKCGGVIGFAAVAGLVVGGLGWATHAALRLEDDRRADACAARAAAQLHRAKEERSEVIHAALWRLDSRLAPALAREDSRPYTHFFALHSPFPALAADGMACAGPSLPPVAAPDGRTPAVDGPALPSR